MNVESSWAQVQNVYQTRYDLIPNLVETVPRSGDFEKSTLTQVTELVQKLVEAKICLLKH